MVVCCVALSLQQLCPTYIFSIRPVSLEMHASPNAWGRPMKLKICTCSKFIINWTIVSKITACTLDLSYEFKFMALAYHHFATKTQDQHWKAACASTIYHNLLSFDYNQDDLKNLEHHDLFSNKYAWRKPKKYLDFFSVTLATFETCKAQ